jgi:hypothetical protein
MSLTDEAGTGERTAARWVLGVYVRQAGQAATSDRVRR